jgi:hypothetical protein
VARVLEEREDLRGRMIAWGVECPVSEGNFLFPDFGGRAEAVYESLRLMGFWCGGSRAIPP